MNLNDITSKSSQDAVSNAHQHAPPGSRLAKVLRIAGRILLALVSLAIALFCGFGFLDSFEPGNGLIWKIGYGALACGFFAGAVLFVRGCRANRQQLENQ